MRRGLETARAASRRALTIDHPLDRRRRLSPAAAANAQTSVPPRLLNAQTVTPRLLVAPCLAQSAQQKWRTKTTTNSSSHSPPRRRFGGRDGSDAPTTTTTTTTSDDTVTWHVSPSRWTTNDTCPPRAAHFTPEDVAVAVQRECADVLRIFKVVRAIRYRGHFAARLDPLGRSLGPLREGYERVEAAVPEDGADIARLLEGYPDELFLRGRRVTPAQYLGLHNTAPGRKFFFGSELATLDPSGLGRKKWWSLDEVLTRCAEVYTGTLTAEYNHISSVHKKRWLMGRLEGFQAGRSGWLTKDERRAVLRRLIRADTLETFLGQRFPSAKRFGLEGAEATIPGIQAVVDAAGGVGTESIVVGMAHRGRLNILNSVFGKPLGAICTEMKSEGRSTFNVGDVRYHLGTRTMAQLEGTIEGEPGPRVELSMAPNPSHLEAVNAVVAGMVRSKQMKIDPGRGGRSRTAQRKVLALLLHGRDAAPRIGP